MPLPLIADTTPGDGRIALWMALASAVTAGVTQAANWWLARRKESRADAAADHLQRRAERQEDQRTVVEYMDAAIKRQDAENDALHAEIRTLRAESERVITGLRSEVTDLVSHLRYLEALLEAKGVQFTRYRPRADRPSPVEPHGPTPPPEGT